MRKQRTAVKGLIVGASVAMAVGLGASPAQAWTMLKAGEEPTYRLTCGQDVSYTAANGSRNRARFAYYSWDSSGYRSGVWNIYDQDIWGNATTFRGNWARGCN
ncbi:hypothetical protein [Blastococcus sp. TF02-8]|uniref:hypothetical protein n=1 Tax=Blastococcus sp. TF02-8 TaxID=2250574 RepID=UPI0011BF1D57|nr:hypothetical protein [Blastococcus sp. TF02-8]